MRKLIRRMRYNRAFTLVELMIVVTIVAILALIAIPLYSANTTAAVMSEGVAGAGAIRTALRIYGSSNGGFTGATLSNIGVATSDLEGKYFAGTDYALSAVSASTYTIKAGPPSKTSKSGMPYYTMDQDGSEQGTYYTNQ